MGTGTVVPEFGRTGLTRPSRRGCRLPAPGTSAATQSPDMSADPGETHELTLRDGRTLAFTEWGDPNGSPMLFFHGTFGSRLAFRPMHDAARQAAVRVISADRPGFGRSTLDPPSDARPHHSFETRMTDVADDHAELLDALGLDGVDVMGRSGGGPHVLAFAARHPARVRAATIIVGVAPTTSDEVDGLIEPNQKEPRLVRAGWTELAEFHAAERRHLLAGGGQAFRTMMGRAPAADQAVMGDLEWLDAAAENMAEALRPGSEGWTTEVMAVYGTPWNVDIAGITAQITWWHGDLDANVPLSAARRLAQQVPAVSFRVVKGGHFLHDEFPGMLDDLIRRGQAASAARRRDQDRGG